MQSDQLSLAQYWREKPLSRLLIFILSLGFFIGLSCERMQENQKNIREWFQNSSDAIRVLVTTGHVSALVKEIGKEYVVVLDLIQGESDPHSYQLVKGDSEKFLAADSIFYSGLGLEHSPSFIQQLKKSHAIPIGDGIVSKNPAAAIWFDSTIDPHIWMDISLWAEGVFIVEEALSKIRPDLAPFFHANARQFYEELQLLDKKGKELFQKIPSQSRYLVTTHDAFHYFTRRYLADENENENSTWKKRCKAPEGLAPDGQISTKEILEIANHIVENKISVLFTEVGINRDSICKLQEVLQERNYSISLVDRELYSDSMGKKGTDSESYSGMMWYNMQTIYDAFQQK